MSSVQGMVRSFRISKLHCNWWETVPVVAIFTKFDDLITQVYDRKKEEDENREVAYATLEEKFKKLLKGYKFPPRAYVQFECVFCPPYWAILGLTAFPAIDEDEGNHQEQVGELIKQTAASIDDLALKMLFVNIQQNNLEVCIESAVNKSVVNLFTIAFTYPFILGIYFGIAKQ